MPDVVSEDRMRYNTDFRKIMSKYQEIELLVQIGEYQKGQDEDADRALLLYPYVLKFLSQSDMSAHPQDDLMDWMREVVGCRNEVEIARRAHVEAMQEADFARAQLAKRSKAYTTAKAQLDGIGTLLVGERAALQVLEDDKADDAALEQFAASDHGRASWAP